ncbi:MAG: right-handed parallel beta-helix repeat-containing protein [Pirellulales bacterium]|nr:right-handed parallel beta-helix repeat-containing protein [Pirellulales bacterium]
MSSRTAPFLFLLLFSVPMLLADTAEAKPGATIFVAPSGNDAWSGTPAEANAAKTDGPLATLEHARDKIRAMKKAGPLPAGGVEVVIRGGMYPLAKTLQLDEQDSGTAESPVIYRAADGEKVQVIGGRPITGFTPHRGAILKADVSGQGFKGVYFRQLFFDGRRQHLARWPNFDPQNPYGGGWAYADGQPISMYQGVPDESRRTLHYKKQDARDWSRPEDGQVFVFPRYNWWNNIVPIASIDRDKRLVTLTEDASYAIRPGDRYYVQNMFEELDAPGEWYLDRNTETLYFWPPAPMEGKTVYAPTLRTLLQLGQGTHHITIRGLTLECCEGNAIYLARANDCLVAGNTIRNVGDYGGSGVVFDGGLRNGAVGNDIYEVGSNGVALFGGDRNTLTPGEHYADNNYIHHTGVFYKQGVGVVTDGVGNRATHNLIHDCPRFGICFRGNNHVIEYNHVRHVTLETSDTGAIYTCGRDWVASRGTRIAYNYFHDILGYGKDDNGRWISPHYAWGIYLDDNTCGVDVIGNIVARAIRGLIHLHNGRDTIIENNILIDGTQQQFECNGWTEASGWKGMLPPMVAAYEAVVNQPAWKNMRNMDLHPNNALLPNGMIMANNILRRNIFYYGTPDAKLFGLRDFPLKNNQSDYNLAYHFGKPLEIGCTGLTRSGETSPADTPVDQWPKWWRAAGLDRHSIVADPLFVDPAKDDYRLRPDSPALKLGFQPIPVDKIGPYADPLRASWPIVEAEGAREKPLQP